MSLTSWLANLLVPSQGRHLAPADGPNTQTFVEQYVNEENVHTYPGRRKEHVRAMEEQEEEEDGEGRPPYLHVSFHLSPS